METMLAVGEGARQESLTLRVDESAPPSVELTRADGTVSAHVGADLFECLKSVRRLLESDGLLICCQGARPSVFPSGMNRQMSNGRLAYPLRRDPPLTDADLVDIFAPADFSEVASIEDQDKAVRDFFGFPKR